MIVTGGAQGIGAAFAIALAKEGAKVAVCDILDPATTVAAITQAGGETFGQVCDITDGAAVAALVDAVLEKFGKVDGPVNNAALFASPRCGPSRSNRFRPGNSIGCYASTCGTVEMIKAVLPAMRRQGYVKIVNILYQPPFISTCPRPS